MIRNKAVHQYLERYATAESREATPMEGVFDHVLVVPARREQPSLLEGIHSALPPQTLLIVVINRAANAGPAQADADLHLQGELMRQWGGSLASETSLAVDDTERALFVLNQALPPGQGVGLARRIGCDVACALWARGRLRSPFIHMTDADVTLPADYFAASDRYQETAFALTYPFVHTEGPEDEAVNAATAKYERFLRYYVLGLAWARSPYAFHTIGSTLAVRADAYAAVRGVPRREAAEDFYLLNKVAKIGPIIRPVCAPLRIRARTSNRVPFGTGASVRRIAEATARGEPFTVYHPEAFARLRTKLEAVAQTPHGPERFDALATLRYVRAQRTEGWPDLPLDDALAFAPFVKGIKPEELYATEEAQLGGRPVSVRAGPLDSERDAPHDLAS